MSNFTGVNGQSLFDVCCNTYGSLDYLYKLLQDSDIPSIDAAVNTGDVFTWDSALVVDQQVNRYTTLSGKIFATAATSNGNTFYVVIGQDGKIPTNQNFIPPNNFTPVPSQYQKTSATSYTITVDGEDSIYLSTLIGKDILQIELEIKPLKADEFSWNKVTGMLTINAAVETFAAQTLYILYQEIITL
jgi:hypothetical protein